MTSRTCEISGCGGIHYARGWCEKHYARWRAHRDPNAVRYVGRPSETISAFERTGLSSCAHHGEHADWGLTQRMDRRGKPYRQLRCLLCDRERTRRWVEARPGYQREYATSVRGRGARLVSGARNRAAKIGVPFDLSIEWFVNEHQRQDGRCAYTGVPLDFVLAPNGGRNRLAPSLDRRVPSDGYTQANTALVCWKVNDAKRDLSDTEFFDLCRLVADSQIVHL